MLSVRRIVAPLLVLALIGLGGAGSVAPAAADANALPTTPTTNDGERWRIGYYEGGQYTDYEVITKAMVRGLIELGWMEPLEMAPENDPEPGGFWRWLAANAQSDYIEFVEDAYYAPGNFDPNLRPEVREEAVTRFNETGDIDLILALGTWAGQDLARDDVTTPIVVASTSDPIGSGIIPSADDSGHDHVHAKVEPDRYQRQVQLFHDIIGFGRLGIVYEDSPEGRTFGGVNAVEEVAADLGFEIVRCNAPFSGVPQEEAEASVAACYEEVSRTADAIYITVHRGVTLANMPNVLKPIVEAKLPSFSMLGSTEVRHGALMSIAQADFSYVGLFHAETIARIFNGATPRDLVQRWDAPAKIALNLKTAQVIGFDPPVDIMLAADEIYEEIEGSGIPGVN